MNSRVLKVLKSIKSYANSIGLGIGGWIKVFVDYVFSFLCYGFNAEDYFVIGNGYTLSNYQKKRYYTIRRALKVQNKANNPDYIHFLENKAEALSLFKDVVSRNWLYAPTSTYEDFMGFINKVPVFIAKPVDGMCGHGIEKYSVADLSSIDLKTLYNQFSADKMLLEECLKAHDSIYLGTKALSTFRIFTMMDVNGHVHVLKAKYRVGTGDAITDTASGCIAYPISIKHGVIEGPGITEGLYSNQYFYHPGCDKLVVGMRIPMWDRALEVVTKAAKMIPQVRYIGWDVAITNNSVEIIEGNHNPYHGTFEIMGLDRLWWPSIKSLL